MTSSKIAGGVTRDTSYLAYLAITFHTSPIHNIFIVQALYESPIQLHRPGIVDRYQRTIRRTAATNYERWTYESHCTGFSNILVRSWVEIIIYAGNWMLKGFIDALSATQRTSFSSSTFIIKMNCLPTICFLRIPLFHLYKYLLPSNFRTRLFSDDTLESRRLNANWTWTKQHTSSPRVKGKRGNDAAKDTSFTRLPLR